MERRRGSYPAHLQAANEARRTSRSVVAAVEGKPCNMCKAWRPLAEFGRSNRTPDGLDHRCRACNRAKALAYYRRNAETINASRRTPEHRARFRSYHAEWDRARRANDLNYRLRRRLRHQLWSALNGRRKAASMLDLLGCSIDEFRAHLERQFTEGMAWDNYGQPGWEIDHVRPCASFDLSDPEQQRLCFHYTNLQPLWGPDNWRKGPRL